VQKEKAQAHRPPKKEGLPLTTKTICTTLKALEARRKAAK